MPADTLLPAQIQATPEEAGLRLDVLLTRRFPDRSRTFFHDAIKGGRVTLNTKPGRAADKVHSGDSISITWPPEKKFEMKGEAMNLDVLGEDDDILVINKPAGLVVHPAKGNWTGTLVQGLLAHAEDEFTEMLDDEMRPGIVHRLDKDTSGALVIAKNPRAREALQRAFHDHTVEKTYLALAAGTFSNRVALSRAEQKLATIKATRAGHAATSEIIQAGTEPHPHGSIETHIGRHPRERKMMAVVQADAGKPAITHYRVLAATDKVSLVEVRILTGRTHQIRVHLAHLKHPVLGDAVYGGRQDGIPVHPARQLLHAWKLQFTHPGSGERVSFTAPIPDDFRQAMETLGLTPPE